MAQTAAQLKFTIATIIIQIVFAVLYGTMVRSVQSCAHVLNGTNQVLLLQFTFAFGEPECL